MKRRAFVSNTIKSGLSYGLLTGYHPTFFSSTCDADKKPLLCIFSKHLQWLDYEGMANIAKKLGFDGIDLTVRPGGHVLPENVETDLPKAVKAVRKAGLEVPMITTRVLNAKDPLTHKILKTSSDAGIKVYRTGWFKYDEMPVKDTLKVKNREIRDLAEVNEKYQIKGAYQNHAGNYVGASCWDLLELLDGVSPKWMGVQFDIRHAHVEGAMSWQHSLEILAPYINSIDIKDYRWEQKNGTWKLKNVPLEDGMVDFRRFFNLLNKFQINVDYSLHFEYELGGANHGAKSLSISEDEFETVVRNDLKVVKGYVLG